VLLVLESLTNDGNEREASEKLFMLRDFYEMKENKEERQKQRKNSSSW
jgi:hypothetical protein